MTAQHTLTIAMAITGALSAGQAFAQPAGLWTGAPAAAWSQDRERTAEERQKQREASERDRDRDRENRTYEEALRARDESRYERAIERFSGVVAMKGTKADAALYWKAYSQDRQGQRAEALASIQALTREYPTSRYLQQGKVLEGEIRRNAGQPARPQDQTDEETKLMALNAIMNSSPEQAMPILEKILTGTASPKLKERALFVLAQSNSAQARDVLRGIAKGNSTPELQSRAISYLGTHGGRESRAILSEVYSSTSDVDMKKRILRAFMVGGEKDRLLVAAQSEQIAELRATAVQQLGVMGAHSELSSLYQKESAVDVKKQIIQAMFVGGNVTRMTELARAEPNPDLRRAAIRNLGLMGARASADALVEIYGSEKDVTVRKAVIQALALSDNAAQLVAIARKETDPTLKKEIVTRLSHMNSKIAIDYMIELLK
ncbi:MAG TPA: HEAT repeat domain-containing protein [Vicinamibacterales bacterium]|nr:HEAT repeat domain-containing protein [Vicinamibacterales bacterium]